MARLIDQVQGHTQIWERLLRQIQNQHVPHAMAFSGPSGVGKRKMAWALAQALICEKSQQTSQIPCGECGACLRVEAQQSESVLLVAPSSGVIKIDAAHSVLEFLSLRSIGKARVVILDEAQLANPQAANTLLKVVEEPPPNTFLIFVLPEISQLLPTLRSRLQVIRFSPLSGDTLKRISPIPIDSWMLASSRGSVEKLESYAQTELTELRQRAYDFLERGLLGGGGFDDFNDVTKDRESLPAFVHFTQELLRDWTLPVTERLHSDLNSHLQKWPTCSEDRKVELWRAAFQMEGDIQAHVDRNLVLQNFFYRLQRELR